MNAGRACLVKATDQTDYELEYIFNLVPWLVRSCQPDVLMEIYDWSYKRKEGTFHLKVPLPVLICDVHNMIGGIRYE